VNRKRRPPPSSRRGERQPRDSGEEVRLQAFLARCGVSSRRGGEDLIREGRVRVNGRVAELGSKVVEGRDRVEVDGREVRTQRREWIALHKPRGYVTTKDDPEGRKTVYDLLPRDLHHLFHVGRLDRDSSGVLLLSNDGELANRLLHPRYGTTKEYYVDVEGEPSRAALRDLVSGVQLEDGMAHAVSAHIRSEKDADLFRVVVVMEEGRQREVRRMFEALGHPVRRLFRKRFAAIEVGRLRPGEWRRLSQSEIRSLAGDDA
jgi:23S rRNA pseudouridine2605 synthase